MNAFAPWRQAACLTLGAGVLLAALVLLPRGPALTPMDFLADKAAVLQFCDPFNSRPLIAAGRPAVTLAVEERTGGFVLTLTTASGKPVGPEDLLPRGHPEVRLTITDRAGTRSGPVRATPGAKTGEWGLEFAPRGTGPWQVAAVFTPAATGQEIAAKGKLDGSREAGP